MEAPSYIAAGLAASYLLLRERRRVIGALKRLSKQSRQESLMQEKSTDGQIDERRLPATPLDHDQLGVLENWRQRLGRHISSEDGWEIAA
jgi:hypothetical protein